jgi:hypothetical protein
MEQLKEIAATVNKEKLSPEAIAMLQEVLPAKYYEQHR